MRHSLLLRLLVLSLTVALGAVVATAALATYSTSTHLRGELERSASLVETDATIYAELLEYAADHDSWNGVEKRLRELAKRHDRRIALTDSRGVVLADSATLLGAGAPPLPSTAAATVDATEVGTSVIEPATVTATPAWSGVAVSPTQHTWRMTDAERAERRRLASSAVACLREQGVRAQVEPDGPDGVPQVLIPVEDRDAVILEGSGSTPVTVLRVVDAHATDCIPAGLYAPSAAAVALNHRQTTYQEACLRAAGSEFVVAEIGNGLRQVLAVEDGADVSRTWSNCRDQALEQALRHFVAPPARLFLGSSERFDAFRGDGLWRTAATAFAVLLVAATITVLAGRRMVRPIHALTSAAQRMRAGDRSARVPADGRDEVARLGAAFNAMAESIAASEAQRRDLVSDVAHELRTPLSNVRGYLEAAEDGVVPLDRDLVASLREEALLLERLVEDLQELALADAGMLRMHPEDADAAEITRQVVVAHRTRAEAGGVELTVSAPATAPLVVDPSRLRQALGNLVDNALKYTPSGGTVHVTVDVEDEVPDERVRFAVSDTGPGIAAEHLPRLFDRFYRADRSRSRTTGGSGLGLAITKHLVEAHGGEIRVESVEGEGTTFTIAIPRPVRTGSPG